jgi:hypothetical protein
MTLRKGALSTMTLSITVLRMMTFRKRALSITALKTMTLSITAISKCLSA